MPTQSTHPERLSRRQPELSERLNTPISTDELERRWTNVRAAMEADGIDVLVLQNNSDSCGGYVRWFTDMPASYYPTTVVFPRESPMSVVAHGPLGEVRELESQTDGVWRGVERVFSTASFPSAPYTREYDAEFALTALEPFAGATVGLVGTAQMSFAFGERLRRGLPGAQLIESSELVDRIKAIKSEEEQALIRATAAMQDEVMKAALDAVEPGKKESDIAAVARRRAQELGSEAGIYMAGSAPVGTPAPTRPRHFQNRTLRRGDVFALLVEIDGPGGMYTELGRMCTLGPVPKRLHEELEFALEAQRFTLERLRPGAAAAEIFAEYNEFLQANSRPPERRVHCHGQGYDLVERPFVRFDETMTIEAGINMACHPKYVRDGIFAWICDNYLIGPDGPGPRLHSFPQAIVER
ncbi:MAG TPA: M24 family metallopeptidase [Solirubrobacteraceae bacterium]|nr:M24 family metallopeptidase [Solirubrobacteraceae bacterium]